MWDLFKSEIIRFRTAAVAAALVHLMALGFMARVVDLAQQPRVVHWAVAGAYALAGMLLGLYQMGSYRKPSQWLTLLHRPMSHARVAAALAAAAAAVLLVAVALPLLLIAAWQEALTPRVVDLRHWMVPLSAWLIATCAYLAGAFCSLRGWRWAAAPLVLLVWLFASRAYGFGLLAVESIVLVWLATMLRIAFTPDLSSPPRGLLSTAAIALPLLMGVYVLLVAAMFCAEMLWVAEGSHPNNMPVPPAGGHNEVEKMDGRARMLAALQGSRHPDAPLLREQIRLSEPLDIGVQMQALPQKHELANVRPMQFDDGGRRERWVFSHDDMRLHGYRLADRHPLPVLGVGTHDHPFPEAVLPVGSLPGLGDDDAVLFGGGTLYQYVGEIHQVLPRLRVDGGETLLGASPVGASLGTLSDRALYIYDGRALVEDAGLMTPRLRVPLPGAIGDLGSLEMIELIDGYLIVATYSARAHAASGAAPYQVALRTHDDGVVETVHRRALGFDYPPIYRHRAWWPSPLLNAAGRRARDLLAPPLPLDATRPAPLPGSMMWLAGVLALLALAAGIWRTARTGLSPAARGGWIAACAVLGLPALAVLWLWVPQREEEPGTGTGRAPSAAHAAIP